MYPFTCEWKLIQPFHSRLGTNEAHCTLNHDHFLSLPDLVTLQDHLPREKNKMFKVKPIKLKYKPLANIHWRGFVIAY